MNGATKLWLAEGVACLLVLAFGCATWHRVPPPAPPAGVTGFWSTAGHGIAWVYADDLVPGPVCAPIYDAQGRVECMVLVTQSNGTFSAWRK